MSSKREEAQQVRTLLRFSLMSLLFLLALPLVSQVAAFNMDAGVVVWAQDIGPPEVTFAQDVAYIDFGEADIRSFPSGVLHQVRVFDYDSMITSESSALVSGSWRESHVLTRTTMRLKSGSLDNRYWKEVLRPSGAGILR